MKTPDCILSVLACWTLACFAAPAATRFVWPDSPNPASPFADWTSAAHTIQDAVDAASAGDTVLVTNGIYAVGGRVLTNAVYNVYGQTLVDTVTNRVAITNPITVASVSGPAVTWIVGAAQPGGLAGLGSNAVRCVYLGTNALLSGFTLTNGHTDGQLWLDYAGGGAWSAGVISNCVLSGNVASMFGGGVCGGRLFDCILNGNTAVFDDGGGGGAAWATLYRSALTGNMAGGIYAGGGGAYFSTLYQCTLLTNSAFGCGGAEGCTLYNCLVVGNSAETSGGTCGGTLYNCTISGNSAHLFEGGVGGGTLWNCIVFYNSAPSPNYEEGDVTLNYSCTTPLPTNGVGNITNAPLFVDYASGDLHLQSNSPCINAGNNDVVNTATDLDGNLRIVSGTVDIGAYEYQGTGSRISYAWLQQYGLPTDGSADFIDSDHDGMNNWQEWVCGTNPTNAQSALRMVSALPTGTNVSVTWESVAGVNYFLERSANLAVPFTLLATNILGQAGTTSYADTNAAGVEPLFYRVGVTSP